MPPTPRSIRQQKVKSYLKNGGDPITSLGFVVLQDAIEAIKQGNQGAIIWLISEPLADAVCQLLHTDRLEVLRNVYLEMTK